MTYEAKRGLSPLFCRFPHFVIHENKGVALTLIARSRFERVVKEPLKALTLSRAISRFSVLGEVGGDGEYGGG